MRLLFGFVILWIVLGGINIAIKNKFNLKDEIAMIITLSLVTLVLFVGGLLNIFTEVKSNVGDADIFL